MTRLTLIRHAKSSWKGKSLSDFERPLNKRGRQNAVEMGKLLAERRFQPDMMITSPARGAFATAQAIAGEIAWPVESLVRDPQLYKADVETLMQTIRNLDDRWRHVVLFGHNPAFTELANFLANAGIENLPTCGVLDLELGIDHWSETEQKSGRTTDFDYPQNKIKLTSPTTDTFNKRPFQYKAVSSFSTRVTRVIGQPGGPLGPSYFRNKPSLLRSQ